MTETSPETFDFVIVGGGPAGLVLAARLSEDPSIRVLVLEAGDDLSADPRVNVPAMGLPTLSHPPTSWKYKTTPQPGLGGREISFPQGRILGGSTAFNGLNYSPPSKADVESWAALGNPGWGWDSFSGSLRKSYSLTGSSRSTEAEGPKGHGPLQLVLPGDVDGDWARAWRETFSGLGLPTDMDIFSDAPRGALSLPDTVHPVAKERSYAVSAYLEPARSRPNLVVWSGVLVEKIVFDATKTGAEPVATGVLYRSTDGSSKTVEARREVIVSAGTINSPKLLELSGIGAGDRLRSLGIEVVVDNPHVGENLQNHPMCVLTYEVKDGVPTMDPLVRQVPEAVGAAMEAYGARKEGPLARSGVTAVAQLSLLDIEGPDGGKWALQQVDELLAKSSRGDSAAGADGVVPPTTAAFAQAHEDFVRSVLASSTEASGFYLNAPGFGELNADGSHKSIPPGEQGYVTVVVMLPHPLSRGSVHATSSSPEADPVIDPRFLAHPLDTEILARHVHFVETRLAGQSEESGQQPFAGRLKRIGAATTTTSGGNTDSLESAREKVRAISSGAHHYTSSCSMMPRAMGGVVDPELRVYGCRNLRVCDASVVPLTPRANTQATVYAVAEHAATIIQTGLA